MFYNPYTLYPEVDLNSYPEIYQRNRCKKQPCQRKGQKPPTHPHRHPHYEHGGHHHPAHGGYCRPGDWHCGKPGNWRWGKPGNWRWGRPGNWRWGRPGGFVSPVVPIVPPMRFPVPAPFPVPVPVPVPSQPFAPQLPAVPALPPTPAPFQPSVPQQPAIPALPPAIEYPAQQLVKNYTFREVNLYKEDGTLGTTYPKEPGPPATVDVTETIVGELEGLPLVSQVYGAIKGLPAPDPGTIYIVPPPTLTAAKEQGRTDVVALDLGPGSAVRDTSGNILGGKRFIY